MQESRHIKILHVIDSGGLYGAEKVLISLVSEQVKQGLSPEIASIGEKGIESKPLENEAVRLGLPIKVFRMKSGLNLHGALQIRNYAVKNRFNLYHSHGYKGNILLGLMPKWLRRIPLISTLHGYTSIGGMNRMWLYEWLDRKVLSRHEAVVLVSGVMSYNSKLVHLNTSKLRVIPNGIGPMATEQYATDEPVRAFIVSFCEKSFIIGAVGRLSPEKGFHHLIEAFRMVAEKMPDCKLLILGEGEQRKSLEKMIQDAGLQDKVLLPGYVSNATSYMKYFNIFVISSLTEGLPITLLEAMREGVPVISTNAGGIAHALCQGKNGLLVESAAPEALARAIERVQREEGLGTMLAKSAQKKVLLKYSTHRMAASYLELYSEFLSK